MPSECLAMQVARQTHTRLCWACWRRKLFALAHNALSLRSSIALKAPDRLFFRQMFIERRAVLQPGAAPPAELHALVDGVRSDHARGRSLRGQERLRRVSCHNFSPSSSHASLGTVGK